MVDMGVEAIKNLEDNENHYYVLGTEDKSLGDIYYSETRKEYIFMPYESVMFQSTGFDSETLSDIANFIERLNREMEKEKSSSSIEVTNKTELRDSKNLVERDIITEMEDEFCEWCRKNYAILYVKYSDGSKEFICRHCLFENF
ncbi:hypothetical protein Metev_1655 [Methanohalobium evestigatum Z-7303]|uniref:Uncharacterized protein n=1 Tax=Methanohalobium evestigatum (strain ATCC BAA-1072 / DSM 3721 / NBRC 107634 / OCM 161 / Z-7303) TaxID=644295 RepID=D7EAX8_METEZ|nr:hypothetical protein [Methanohalobium evestigatum]ADI74495.1 hypothetical protein Metev_1655 [Methanohalobium evestigatum Z-7303]